MFDLIIHNGRVVDYKNHLDQVTDIAVKDGRIASIGTALGKAKSHLDAKNLLVVPGIVDSHMHASSWLGGPDSLKMLALAGVTTAIEMAGPVDSVKKIHKRKRDRIKYWLSGTAQTRRQSQLKPSFIARNSSGRSNRS